MRPHVYTGYVTTCAIWCRVSKTEQETANQLDELRQWAQRKGFEITREYVFEVSASNGSRKHREMLVQALADARLGRVEVILIWALDRVSREGVEATLAINAAVRGPWRRGVVAQRAVDRDGRPADGRAARVAVRMDGRRGVPASLGADQSRAGAT